MSYYLVPDALVGEKNLNEALRNFYVNNVASPDKPSSLQFADELYQKADSSHHALIDFWLNKVYIYELAIEAARYRKVKEGHYEVKISYLADKMVINDDGQEERISVREPILIGIYDEQDELLLIKSLLTEEKSSELLLQVNKKPKKVVIDPYFTRLDNKPEDNVFLLK